MTAALADGCPAVGSTTSTWGGLGEAKPTTVRPFAPAGFPMKSGSRFLAPSDVGKGARKKAWKMVRFGQAVLSSGVPSVSHMACPVRW